MAEGEEEEEALYCCLEGVMVAVIAGLSGEDGGDVMIVMVFSVGLQCSARGGLRTREGRVFI